MNKKVLLFGYFRFNLGDDLFVRIVSKRYSNVNFYMYVKKEWQKPFLDLENINMIDQNPDFDKVNIEDYDGFLYVGGSIFIESIYGIQEAEKINTFLNKLKETDKPFFYITCNFGPYKTEEYKNIIEENYKMCKDICFRDKSSYDLFKNLKNVRYAPDIAFSFDYSNVTSKKEDRTIGISVINIENRENLEEKADIYYNDIATIIKNFLEKNYNVKLMSFCKFEKDEIAIEKILERISQNDRKNLGAVKYDGNVEDFIKEYSKCEYMICTRFHSTILSLILKQKIFNIIYSEKTSDFLKDYNININNIKINDLDNEIILEENQFKNISKCKIDNMKEKSNYQFEKFEKWLNLS